MPAPPSNHLSPARPLTRWVWLGLGALVLAVAAAYSTGLGGPFVYDDIPSIVNNPTIRGGASLGDVLLPPNLGGATVSGRPVLNLSFALNHAISGESVWSYHVLNGLIHLTATLVLFGLARRTLARALKIELVEADRLGLALAALWALHPLQTQAVTYTVQRAESLMGLFYLLTVYAFARGGEEPDPAKGKGWRMASVAACALGMATKEVMATAPLLVLLYDRTFVAGSFRAAWQAKRGYYLTLASTWVLLGALVLSTGGNRGGSVGFGTGIAWWAYPLTQFEAVARYLMLAIWPQPLVFEYGTFWVERASQVLPWALVVVPLLAGTAWALVRRPALGFLGAWFFLILAPSSLAPGTTQMIVEHRMYLPLAAALALIVAGGYRRAGRRIWVPAAVVAVIFGTLTAARNHDYRSALALWSDSLEKRPDSPRTRTNLADALVQAGRPAEALAQRETAVKLRPDDPELHYNLGLALAQAKRWPEAIGQYEAALKLRDDANAHSNLALALIPTGDMAGALSHAAAAAKLAPDNPTFHYNYALYLDGTRRWAEAVTEYEAALRLKPDYPEAHNNLGNALLQLGRPAEAVPQYESLLKVRPDSPEAHSNLGLALVKLGRGAEAAPHFETVLKVQPGDFAAHSQLGQLALGAGRAEEAIPHFEAALQSRPDSIETLTFYGRALALARRSREAIAAYEKALRLAPGATGTRYNLANVRFQLGDFPAAQTAYEEVLRQQPDFIDARFNFAATLLRLNRPGEAAAAYEEILRRTPNDATAHAELANILEHTGRVAEAIAHYETAVRLKPDFAVAQQQLSRLRAARGGVKP